MISIVICSVNPVLFSRVSANYREVLGTEPHEIIGIHNARGMCEGYNRGLAQSKGDIVIFSHDDIEILTPEFAPRLKHHLENFDVIGVAGTSRLVGPNWNAAGPPYSSGIVMHTIRNEFQVTMFGAYRRVMGDRQAMDGLFLAFRRDVIERVGWDEQTFQGFHCYDIDTTYRAFKMGYRLAVAADLPILHMSGGNFDQVWQTHAQLFMQKHGATLATQSPRSFQPTAVQMTSMQEALDIMKTFYERLPE